MEEIGFETPSPEARREFLCLVVLWEAGEQKVVKPEQSGLMFIVAGASRHGRAQVPVAPQSSWCSHCSTTFTWMVVELGLDDIAAAHRVVPTSQSSAERAHRYLIVLQRLREPITTREPTCGTA